MGEVVSLLDFILLHADYAAVILLALGALISAIVIFAEYKSKTIYYVFHKRNKFWFAFATVFGTVICCLILFVSVPVWAIILFVAVWSVFVVYTCVRIKSGLKFIHPLSAYYYKKIKNGYAFECSKFFENPPRFLFLSLSSRLELKILQAAYYGAIYDFKKGYVLLSSIKKENLYKSENDEIDYQRATALIFMGNLGGALELLGDPESNFSKNPFVWWSYSYYYELQGNINLAEKYILKAKAIADVNKISDSDKAQIYNNFARIRIMQGNYEEGIRYYKIAYEKIKKNKDSRLLYVILNNLIENVAIYEKDQAKCECLLEDYKKLLQFDTVNNINEYNASCLFVNRAFGQEKQSYELIRRNYDALKDKFKPENKALFNVSNLSILLNGRFKYSWLDAEIACDFRTYEDFNKLPFKEKSAIARQYVALFSQEYFKFLLQKEPYKSIFSYISRYYRTQAISDVEKELSLIEGFEIERYSHLMQYKLSIYKFLQKDEHIDKCKDVYVSLYETMKKAGNSVDAARIMLTLLDECTSPYNQIIKTPFFEKPYYKFLEETYPTDEPRENIDGIHIDILEHIINGRFILLPQKNDVIKQYVFELSDEVESWWGHPVKYEMCFNLCRLFLGLNEKERAKRVFAIFKQSQIPLKSYSLWMQREVENMEDFFLNANF